MFDFTVCKQQNLANSLFVETPELKKYLKKIGTLTKGGGGPVTGHIKDLMPLALE